MDDPHSLVVDHLKLFDVVVEGAHELRIGEEIQHSFVGEVDDQLSFDNDAIIDFLFIDQNRFFLLDFPCVALIESE